VVTEGPPMVRNEAGLLVGYVYVDLEPWRDPGSFVDDAKVLVDAARAQGRVALGEGMYVKWTGQYELLEEMKERMQWLVPLALAIVAVLLWLQFRHVTEVLIVFLSIPFALVGSAWALYLLDYRLSTAVWVGVIALIGLATQTGVVMIVYIDQAFFKRVRAGTLNSLADIIEAHAEGTVQRVRPKLMTVATMLIGLMPLLWSQGTGADVMKRIAAPMVGGLITSAFLTLEIIPVIYTYWRQEQVLWERLAGLDAPLLARLELLAVVQKAGWFGLAGVGVAAFYLPIPSWGLWLAVAASLAVALAGAAAYLKARPVAKQLVWPAAVPAR
jgi:copper/silver efflux system protein